MSCLRPLWAATLLLWGLKATMFPVEKRHDSAWELLLAGQPGACIILHLQLLAEKELGVPHSRVTAPCHYARCSLHHPDDLKSSCKNSLEG